VQALRQRFETDGLLLRILWNIEDPKLFCVDWNDWSDWNDRQAALGINFGSDFRTNDFVWDTSVLYRSASFMRRDLPVAIANGHGNHFCEPTFRFAVLIDPSSVRRGCAFHKDASSGAGNDDNHLKLEPGFHWDPNFQLCDKNRIMSDGCGKKCCSTSWDLAIKRQQGCNLTWHNEYLIGYGKKDILALAYIRYLDDDLPLLLEQKVAIQIRDQNAPGLPIVEMRLPSVRNQRDSHGREMFGTDDMKFRDQGSSSAPFFVPSNPFSD
jgi:hypothetical protein